MNNRALIIIVCVVLAWSAYQPADRFTWWLEVAPIFAGAAILFMNRNAPLTNLSKILLTVWAIILALGGHYTYAEVPLFNWLRDTLELSRNHYDRLGHFAQGFVPAILFREYLLRASPLRMTRQLFLICCCFALALSAFYELLEWWVSITTDYFTGEGATAFLGTQGDVWDTQWDMLCALLGSISSQLIFSKVQWEQVKSLRSSSNSDLK